MLKRYVLIQDPNAGIYPSSFTDVHFLTKIEFSNIVKCRWGSRSAVKLRNGFMAEPWWGFRG